jgi:HD-like signal output (HDOD) protein/CheY-like chemotaxis protein
MNSRLAEAIARLDPLPSPRGAALELMRLGAIPEVSIPQLARVARSDPALAARLIRAANRVGSGGAQRTGSLEQALTRLGVTATRQIALAFSLVGEHRAGRCERFDYLDFWAGSLLRGLCAQAIAARAGELDAQEAFVCGLLAEIGRLALASAQPRAYAELLAQHPEGMLLRRAERARFSADHGELGEALLVHWCFPERLTQALRGYHAIAERSAKNPRVAGALSWAIALAEAVARCSRPAQAPAWRQVALDAAADLGLDAGELGAISAEAVREAGEWAALLELPVPAAAGTDFGDEEPPVAGAPAPAVRVLVADDSEDDRYIVQQLLEEAGHQVHAVTSAEAALAAIADFLPQLVITDWEFPRQDGLSLCRAVRATRLGAALHLVMYTGRARDWDLVAAIEAGADDFVAKTIDREVLRARLLAAARAAMAKAAFAAEGQATFRLAMELAAGARPRGDSCGCGTDAGEHGGSADTDRSIDREARRR